MTTSDRNLAVSLRDIADAVDTVESYEADTLNPDGTVDREALEALAFGDVLDMLAALDVIAAAPIAMFGEATFIGDLMHLAARVTKRAGNLAAAIRLAVNAPAAHRGVEVPGPKSAADRAVLSTKAAEGIGRKFDSEHSRFVQSRFSRVD